MARDYFPHALALAGIEGRALSTRRALPHLTDEQARVMLVRLLDVIERDAGTVEPPQANPAPEFLQAAE